MSYELKKIVRILRTSLLPHRVMEQKNPEKYLSAYSERMIDCIKREQTALFDRSRFVAPDTEKADHTNMVQVKKTIEHYALIDRDTTRALNILYAIFYTKYADDFNMLGDGLDTYYHRIFQKLRSLLLYIRKPYPGLTSTLSNIPHFYRMHRMKEAEILIERITRRFANTDAPFSLVSEQLFNFQLLLTPKWKVTYEHIHECKGVLLCLKYARSLRQKNPGSIMEVFFILHITQHRLRDLYINTVTTLAKQYETTDARLAFYHHQVKLLEQALMEVDPRWFADKIDILEKLRPWLESEIKYLEKVRALHPIPVQQLSPTTSAGEINPDSKLRVNLSIHELSLLFDLLPQSDMVENTDFNELTKRIIPYLKTRMVDEVIFKSVQTKSTKKDKVVYEKLYGKVKRLLGLIGKGM